jgi:hypothetical protein
LSTDGSIFNQTYQFYIDQINTLELEAIALRLGADRRNGRWEIPLLGRRYAIAPEGLQTTNGERPSFEVCVILFKHLLMCPDAPPAAGKWAHYRDLKDAGPLTVYWSDNVENAIVKRFQDATPALAAAAKALGGTPPAEPLAYDLDLTVPALPRIPVRLLFNDAEEGFPANGLLLFRQSSERYLDAESLAVLGALTVRRLTAAV